MKVGQFYAVGRCLIIVTAKERNEMARLLKQSGNDRLAKKVRQSKPI